MSTPSKVSFFGIIFFILFTISSGRVYGEPDMKIIEPLDGTIVVPGQEITVTVESIDGFVIKQGAVIVTLAEAIMNNLFDLPSSFTFKIRKDAIGEGVILVSGKGRSGKIAEDEIKIVCQPEAVLQGLKVNADKISVELDWNGNIKHFYPNSIFSVKGIYSDGVARDIKKAGFPITYESSDSLIVSIDNKGNIQVHKVGQAEIIVSSSGFSVNIPLVFKEPTGLRPSETIPPHYPDRHPAPC